MTALDLDGKTHAPATAHIGPTFSALQISETNWVAASTSYFSPPAAANDWLISPPIDITDASTFLVWEALSISSAYPETYEVRVSTTGDSTVANFTDLLLTVPAELTDFTKRGINLDAYIGQTIQFAFHNNSFDKWTMYLDNIEVKVLPPAEVLVKSLNFEKYNPLNSQIGIKMTVENNGATPLTSVTYDWTVNGVTYTDTVTGLNIPTVATAEISHAIPFDLTEVGEFVITGSLSNPNGIEDDSTDNEISRKIYSLEETPAKKVLVEEATGT